MPIADLVRWNAERGLAGGRDIDGEVRKRIAHMRAGTPYVAERRFPGAQGDRMVEIRGNPMPGGGFVATFTDVTTFRRNEGELKRVAETLELRVEARTAELAAAKGEAERANRAKTRFLAAVSHDLAQPLHAAHLFTHALNQRLAHDDYREAVGHIDGALTSAEGLLAGLLDMSRLDAGRMQASVQPVRMDDWLRGLAAEFRVLAEAKGLSLRCVSSTAWVLSDAHLLRRVVQNFLANAVRYTEHGRIVLGCRRRGGMLSIEVWDTGPGIAEVDRAIVFEEFRRLGQAGEGLGLGLAIAERIARLLGHRLRLDSHVDKGTMFAIGVPIASAAAPQSVPREVPAKALPHRRVLVVDNDPAVLKAMQALLEGWHCEVSGARTPQQAHAAFAAGPIDLLLFDYHLDHGVTGLDLRSALGARALALPCVIITADHGEAVREAVLSSGVQLLHKPLKPLALRSLMARLSSGSAAR